MNDLYAVIPAPPFQNITLGSVTLHGYGLVIGLAIITALTLTERNLKQSGIDITRFTPLALLIILGGLVGARLYHVASEPLRYLNHPADIPAVWNGGLGIYGAVAGGALIAYFLAPRFGIPMGRLADAIAPALLLAQALGRWGNYLNQELFGKPFAGAWALKVEEFRRPPGFTQYETFHPTFLYESAGTLILAGVFMLLYKRWTQRQPGSLFALYVAAYSAVRLIVEPLRIDDAHVLLGLRQNVWVAGVMLLAGLFVAWLMNRPKTEGP